MNSPERTQIDFSGITLHNNNQVLVLALPDTNGDDAAQTQNTDQYEANLQIAHNQLFSGQELMVFGITPLAVGILYAWTKKRSKNPDYLKLHNVYNQTASIITNAEEFHKSIFSETSAYSTATLYLAPSQEMPSEDAKFRNILLKFNENINALDDKIKENMVLLRDSLKSMTVKKLLAIDTYDINESKNRVADGIEEIKEKILEPLNYKSIEKQFSRVIETCKEKVKNASTEDDFTGLQEYLTNLDQDLRAEHASILAKLAKREISVTTAHAQINALAIETDKIHSFCKQAFKSNCLDDEFIKIGDKVNSYITHEDYLDAVNIALTRSSEFLDANPSIRLRVKNDFLKMLNTRTELLNKVREIQNNNDTTLYSQRLAALRELNYLRNSCYTFPLLYDMGGKVNLKVDEEIGYFDNVKNNTSTIAKLLSALPADSEKLNYFITSANEQLAQIGNPELDSYSEVSSASYKLKNEIISYIKEQISFNTLEAQ